MFAAFAEDVAVATVIALTAATESPFTLVPGSESSDESALSDVSDVSGLSELLDVSEKSGMREFYKKFLNSRVAKINSLLSGHGGAGWRGGLTDWLAG